MIFAQAIFGVQIKGFRVSKYVISGTGRLVALISSVAQVASVPPEAPVASVAHVASVAPETSSPSPSLPISLWNQTIGAAGIRFALSVGILQSHYVGIDKPQRGKELVRHASVRQALLWLWSGKIMVLDAAADAVQVLLTDVQSSAIIALLTQAHPPTTIVVIITYLV